jgi:hypothetical protein
VSSIVLGLLAYRLRDYDFTPDVKYLWEQYRGGDELEVKETLTSTLVQSAQKNESRLRDKARWAEWSFYALLVALVFLAADGLVQLLK